MQRRSRKLDKKKRLSQAAERQLIEASVNAAERSEILRTLKTVEDQLRRFAAAGHDLKDPEFDLDPDAKLALITLMLSRSPKLSDPKFLPHLEAAARNNSHGFFQILGLIVSRKAVNPLFSRRRIVLLTEWLDRDHIVERRGKRLISFRNYREGEPGLDYRNPTLGLCYFTVPAVAQYLAIRLQKVQGAAIKGAGAANLASVRKDIQRLGLLFAEKRIVREAKWVKGRIVCEPVVENQAR